MRLHLRIRKKKGGLAKRRKQRSCLREEIRGHLRVGETQQRQLDKGCRGHRAFNTAHRFMGRKESYSFHGIAGLGGGGEDKAAFARHGEFTPPDKSAQLASPPPPPPPPRGTLTLDSSSSAASTQTGCYVTAQTGKKRATRQLLLKVRCVKFGWICRFLFLNMLH